MVEYLEIFQCDWSVQVLMKAPIWVNNLWIYGKIQGVNSGQYQQCLAVQWI